MWFGDESSDPPVLAAPIYADGRGWNQRCAVITTCSLGRLTQDHRQVYIRIRDTFQFEFNNVRICASAEGVKGVGVAISLPGGSTIARNVNVAAGINSNAPASLCERCPIEGMPLVCSGTVQFNHGDVITATAVGVKRVGVAIFLPGAGTESRGVDIAARIDRNAVASINTD